MKIGILTFHRTTNYGAALQAYALQETLLRQGHDAEIIDYNSRAIYSYYDYRIFYGAQSAKTRLGKALRYSYNKATCAHFAAFQEKHMRLSPECAAHDALRAVEERYDAVICGSDQVWNPRAIFGDFDAYLLETAECRKIAYAASAGAVSTWEPYLKTYWRLLHRFDAISVREEEMLAPTERLAQKNASLVVDPTLLLKSEDWSRIESQQLTEGLPKSGYILVYFLGKNPAVIQAARELQKKTGLPLISLGRRIGESNETHPVTGPEEFLALFHHASYVLTSSFHGTVFAVQYQRPFLVFGNGAYNGRMQTLLSALGLQERMIRDEAIMAMDTLNTPVAWDKVEKRLEKERERSLTFLQEALKEEKKES